MIRPVADLIEPDRQPQFLFLTHFLSTNLYPPGGRMLYPAEISRIASSRSKR